MKNLLISLFTFVFVLNLSQSLAQDSYKIVFIQGSLVVEKNGRKVMGGVNDYIQKASILKLKEQTQLILRDPKKNRYCVLQTTTFQKSFTYADIQTIFEKQKKDGMIPSMLNYLAKELEKSSYNERDLVENNMQKKGGVMRSGCYTPLMRYPFNYQRLNITDSIINFNWTKDQETTSYEFELYSGDEFSGEVVNILFKTTVVDTFFLLEKLKIPESFRKNELNWVVYPSTHRRNCARFFFEFIDEQEKQMVLESVEASLDPQDSEENRLIQKIFLLESNKLLLEAGELYQELINTYPSNGSYVELFELFQLRNGMFN